MPILFQTYYLGLMIWYRMDGGNVNSKIKIKVMHMNP